MLAMAGAGYLVELTLALLALLAIMVVANRRLKRSGAGPLAWTLTPQHRLHVVEVEGRRILVGTGPGAAPSLIAELGPEPKPEDGHTNGA